MSNTNSSEKVILVPLDFQEQSLIALSQSYNLSRYTNSTIYLMTVVEKGINKNEVEEKINKLAQETAQKNNVKVKTIVAEGNPFVEINKAVERLNPEIVLIGLNSTINVKSILGNNAFRLVRECLAPVITIKGKQHRDGCKSILLPLDLTKETREKVGKAIEFAKYFDAKVQVLSVLDKSAETFENKLLSYSNQVKKYIREKGVACGNKTVRGKNVAEMVVNYAKEVDADLVMIMSKAELNFKEFFIGTTAQQVINTSAVPVLSIRPMKRKDTTSAAMPF